MEINLSSILNRKDLKKLECQWSKFLNKRNYFIPKSIADYKENISNIFTEIRTQNTSYFFKKTINDELIKFVSIIYENPLINSILCHDSIYNSVICEITASLNSNNKSPFDYAINSISTDLNKKIDNHLFYFPLIGFVLSDIKEISMGEVTIVHFDETEILDRSVTKHKDEYFTEYVRNRIKENFIGRSTIIIPSYGDRFKSEQIAREKAEIVVNYFRFITCLLVHERIDENLIKISLESAWPSKNDQFFL